jgi:integrase
LTLLKHTAVWKGKAAAEIKTSEIEQLIRGADVGAQSTRLKLYQYVSGVFAMLEGKGIIAVSPFRHIKRRALIGKKIERLREIMSEIEVNRLISYLKENDDPWHSIVAVTYNLGLRAGEAIALSWEQVDLGRNVVTVDRSYDKKKEMVGPTKSGKLRTVPINKSLAGLLKKMRDEAPEGQQFVLPRVPDFVLGHAARSLKSAQSKLGIKMTTFHSLRASFITHLLLKGVPVTVVQHLVGHADLKTTLRYIRVSGADVIGATDVLDRVGQGKEASDE